MTPPKIEWIVRLGRAEWARHTQEQRHAGRLRLLGSVQHGAQIGALALDDEGRYYQVNGDHLSPLSAGLVRKALRAASALPPRAREPLPAAAPPTVIVRRRRIIRPE